jgi:hypothetical protein
MTRQYIDGGSFRDPSGFIFFKNATIYRQINQSYRDNYNLLLKSGLYQTLIENKMLVSHIEQDISLSLTDSAFKVISPTTIPFISYPYEWCFSQLKDAALLTLQIQQIAMKHGMSLKDASAYNIQFLNGKPIFIDTLSFEKREEGKPWIAYRQFCQHFLAPLILMRYRDIRLNQLLKIQIDGIPLDLTAKLLPWKCLLNFSLLSHIYLHAKSQAHFRAATVRYSKHTISTFNLMAILDNLSSVISKLVWNKKGSEWGNYYCETNYSEDASSHKHEIVGRFIAGLSGKSLIDLGGNNGEYSRIASARGITTLCIDLDPVAVEKNYLKAKTDNDQLLLPLLIDLSNPSPAIGWAHEERKSFQARFGCDTAMALALIHHLAISNNLPFESIAKFLRSICTTLIIEWVPKNDSQIVRMLSTRQDIFTNYNEATFEAKFSDYFLIAKKEKIRGSARVLYLMKTH